MLVTFKETILSISDKTYGRAIIAKPVKSVLWYFSRYILFFAVVPLILGVILLTYFTPQFPKLVSEHVPEGYLSLTGGLLDTNYSQSELSFPDATFRFTPDQTLPDALASLPIGLHIYRDGLVQVEEGGSYRVQRFTDLPNFRLEKSEVISWLNHHTVQLWLILIATGLSLWALMTALFWSFRVASLLLWSVGFYAVGRLVSRPLSYLSAFKLAVYAAVPALVISVILAIAPNKYLEFLNLVVFLFLALSWTWNLPTTQTKS